MKVLKLCLLFFVPIFGTSSVYSQQKDSSKQLSSQAKMTEILLDNNMDLRKNVTKISNTGVVYFKEKTAIADVEKVVNISKDVTYKLITERKSKKEPNTIKRRFQQYY